MSTPTSSIFNFKEMESSIDTSSSSLSQQQPTWESIVSASNTNLYQDNNFLKLRTNKQSSIQDQLIAMVEKGDTNGVMKIIEDGVIDLTSVRGFNDYTLLHYAVNKGENNYKWILRRLIEMK